MWLTRWLQVDNHLVDSEWGDRLGPARTASLALQILGWWVSTQAFTRVLQVPPRRARGVWLCSPSIRHGEVLPMRSSHAATRRESDGCGKCNCSLPPCAVSIPGNTCIATSIRVLSRAMLAMVPREIRQRACERLVGDIQIGADVGRNHLACYPKSLQAACCTFTQLPRLR